ncbi:MAG: PLP-dependent aspartate aminotransferase family protein [Anaerolineae bacterium]|nr:PLP-dependent aspartate aminotransferase family protein [Anaerolineae bacterium]
MEQTKLGVQTLAIHAGEQPDPTTKAASPNLVMSTTYVTGADIAFSVEGAGEDDPHIYTRWSNPTVDQLETKLAILEGAEAGLCFASGMAAINALFVHFLSNGDRLVMSDVAYAGASELTNYILPNMGIDIVKVDMTDLAAVAGAIAPDIKLVYLETPVNPIMRLTDIRAVAAIAHNAGVPVAVDSTFATPIATQPLALGADFVIHSLTKYIGGHGDALGGAILGPKAVLTDLRRRINVRLGGVLSPFNAWLILRGAATLPLRMKAHADNAGQVAQFLEGHPAVRRVIYPGLPSHPQHDLARQQMKNFSGMLTFQVEDGPRTAHILAERLNIWHYAVSLGHHRSLIFFMNTNDLLQTSFRLSPAQLDSYRTFAGDGIFRVSVGLEDADDLCQDLAQALSGV